MKPEIIIHNPPLATNKLNSMRDMEPGDVAIVTGYSSTFNGHVIMRTYSAKKAEIMDLTEYGCWVGADIPNIQVRLVKARIDVHILIEG